MQTIDRRLCQILEKHRGIVIIVWLTLTGRLSHLTHYNILSQCWLAELSFLLHLDTGYRIALDRSMIMI